MNCSALKNITCIEHTWNDETILTHASVHQLCYLIHHTELSSYLVPLPKSYFHLCLEVKPNCFILKLFLYLTIKSNINVWVTRHHHYNRLVINNYDIIINMDTVILCRHLMVVDLLEVGNLSNSLGLVTVLLLSLVGKASQAFNYTCLNIKSDKYSCLPVHFLCMSPGTLYHRLSPWSNKRSEDRYHLCH